MEKSGEKDAGDSLAPAGNCGIKTVKFGEKTCIKDGVLFIDKAEMLTFLQTTTASLENLDIDIAAPGEKTRIIR